MVAVVQKKKTLLTEVSKCRAGQESQLLPQRKELEGSWGLEELEDILAVTSKSRRLGERLKATTGKYYKTFLQWLEEGNKL